MRKYLLIFFTYVFVGKSMAQDRYTPDVLYGDLFKAVQENRVFADSKTFVDCIPKKAPAFINEEYRSLKPRTKEELHAFVDDNFCIPQLPQFEFQSKGKDLEQHINNLWIVLRRRSDTLTNHGSLLPLPKEYIVPGGRFREVYYWDSYFTFLGLKENRQYELMEHMLQNFAHLINTYGHMPNGNRTYYLSRSQPPFFSLMLDLLAAVKGRQVYTEFLPAMEKEYDYWMDKSGPTNHIAVMPDGSRLNRYYDQLAIPRQESYLEDVTVAGNTDEKEKPLLYKNIRSAAESGWDFSSRWMKDGKSLHLLQTTNIVPVDLNCLLYHLEQTLANAYKQKGNLQKSKLLQTSARKRKAAINHYLWSKEKGWFLDYLIVEQKQSPILTLAGMFPFFMKLAGASAMDKAEAVIRNHFLQPGGVVTTLNRTGEQWDAPNGWAPLQWITIIGLENYNQWQLAKTIATRWITLNKHVFVTTGKLVEKYDVMDADKPGGGGEYPSQDGFGWTNGVLLALLHKYH